MDLVTLAAAVVRPGAPLGLRDERFAVSVRLIGALLDGRMRLSDLSPDFAREVHAAPADARATLILPAGPGPARIDLGGRQFVLPAALRDALVAVLNGGGEPAETVARAPASAVPASDAGIETRLSTQALLVAAPAQDPRASSAAANALAASGALRAARNETTQDDALPAVFEAPVLDQRDVAGTADRIAARVTDSGVFFEAHVAQWARGDRSMEAVLSEAQQLARAALADSARAQARTSVQVEVLQRHTIALAGPAWQGQQMLLELGRDPQVLPDGAGGASGDGNGERVFVARLAMELPRLGSIEVRLRLAGAAVAVTVESGGAHASVEEFVAALPEFADALAARGLRPVWLQAIAAADVKS